jgi:hypothetical protein
VNAIRAYLIDDHHVLRQAVVEMLNEADGIVVVDPFTTISATAICGRR